MRVFLDANILFSAAKSDGAVRARVRMLVEQGQECWADAMRAGCDVLVTGDRTHFGVGYGKAFGGVTIHSPRSLADLLLG